MKSLSVFYFIILIFNLFISCQNYVEPHYDYNTKSSYFIENELEYDLETNIVFKSEYNYISEYDYLGKIFSLIISSKDKSLAGSGGGFGCANAIPPHYYIESIEIKSKYINLGNKITIIIDETTNWNSICKYDNYEYTLIIDDNLLKNKL